MVGYNECSVGSREGRGGKHECSASSRESRKGYRECTGDCTTRIRGDKDKSWINTKSSEDDGNSTYYTHGEM